MDSKVNHYIKKAGGNIFSSLHNITGTSVFIRTKMSFLSAVLHNSLKNFPSSAIA
jgi:hypothetical protein